MGETRADKSLSQWKHIGGGESFCVSEVPATRVFVVWQPQTSVASNQNYSFLAWVPTGQLRWPSFRWIKLWSVLVSLSGTQTEEAVATQGKASPDRSLNNSIFQPLLGTHSWSSVSHRAEPKVKRGKASLQATRPWDWGKGINVSFCSRGVKS